MNNSFKQLKSKYLLGAILKSAACGVSAGLFVVGVLLLSLKLGGVPFSALYYALIGVGVALSGGGVAFIFFRPTDKKVAVRLDGEFGLEERVQTALEFEGAEGTIVEMQREDAEAKLQTLPKSKIQISKIWQYCASLAVALAMILTGIFIPSNYASASGPGDDPTDVTNWHLVAVQEIIDNVMDSNLASGPKGGVVGVLEELLEDLDGVSSVDKTVVTAAIKDVEKVVLDYASYRRMAAALNDAGSTYVAKAVLDGGNSYRYYYLTTYTQTKTFYAGKKEAVQLGLTVPMKTFIEELDGLTTADLIMQKLDGVFASINAAVSAAKPAAGDSLGALFSNFATDIFFLKTNPDALSDEAMHDSAVSLFETFREDLCNEVSVQAYHMAMSAFVGNRLKSIFGMPVDEPETPPSLPKPDDGNGGGGEGKPDDGNQSGGYGQGGLVGGGLDEIYDPETGTYRKYSDEELRLKYLQILNAYLSGEELTEEQKNMARAYFDLLFGAQTD